MDPELVAYSIDPVYLIELPFDQPLLALFI
jgi:hypothetical protein